MISALIGFALIATLLPDQVLWQIGGAALALAPDGYRLYQSDGLHIVGQSKDVAWPYVLPGPVDAWAGHRSHEHDVWFGLKRLKPGARCRVVVRLRDSHWSAPPKIALVVNGSVVGQFQTPTGHSDASLTGDDREASPSEWVIPLPTARLRIGNNVVGLRNGVGSWAVIDSVRMEGDGLEPAPVQPDVLVAAQAQEQAIYRTATGPVQRVNLEITNIGPPAEATWRLKGGAKGTLRLAAGRQVVSLETPAAKATAKRRCELKLGNKTVVRSVLIEAIRPWKVLLIPHSHVDVGYTNLQPEVEIIHKNAMLDAVALHHETRAFPDEARYRFTVETMWPLERFLSKGSIAETQPVLDAMKQGWMGIDAAYGNFCSALMRPEELMRAFRWAGEYRAKYGLPISVSSQTDAPGVTWGAVSALHQAGLRYLVLWPNNTDRIGGARKFHEDRPFYWVSPSGKERVLVWQMAAYGVAHALRGGRFTDRFHAYRSDDPTRDFIEPYIFPHLRSLADSGYPYDVYAMPWSLSDNCPIDADAPYAVRAWNKRYVTPRIVLATAAEAMRELEAKYAKRIPILHGDYSPYWEDGAGSSAAETAMNRASADRIVQAESLFAMLRPAAFPAAKAGEAWRNVLLYSEHTWGAYNSISEPDSDFVSKQWAIKQSFAREADRLSRELVGEAVGAEAGPAMVDVFNTNSWSRSDLVLIAASLSTAGDLVEDERGSPLPSQRLASGDLAVLVKNVPGFGARRLSIKAGRASVPDRPVAAKSTTLSSSRYEIVIEPTTGNIRSIRDLLLGKDLIDSKARHGFNEYLYLPGADLKDLKTSRGAKVAIVESGPLVATLRITSDAPGATRLTREIALVAGLDRIGITDQIDKLPIREKEGVHFAFPFAVPDGQMRVGIAWGVVRPDLDQIPGSCKEWMNTQRFVDVSNDSFGVTWTSLDAPLIEVGDVTARVLGARNNPDEWMRHLPKTQTLYSWALNNHWHTNYRADQEGLLTFRYCIASHGKLDTSAAERFGTELSQPLVVAPSVGASVAEPPLVLSTNKVIATSLKPSEDGKALILRLYGPSGKTERVRLRWRKGLLSGCFFSDLSERRGEPAGEPVTVPGYGVVTLRAELARN